MLCIHSLSLDGDSRLVPPLEIYQMNHLCARNQIRALFRCYIIKHHQEIYAQLAIISDTF
jgi:hypothetical protein